MFTGRKKKKKRLNGDPRPPNLEVQQIGPMFLEKEKNLLDSVIPSPRLDSRKEKVRTTRQPRYNRTFGHRTIAQNC